jgi:hypothetical protein
MCYVHTREYYSVLKGKEILTHVTTWMNLEDVVPNKVSQSLKENIVWFYLAEGQRVSVSWRQKGNGGCWGLQLGNREL